MASHEQIMVGDRIQIAVKDCVLSLHVADSRRKLSAATVICWKCIPDCTKIDTRWIEGNSECCAAVVGGRLSGLESICVAWNKTTQTRGATSRTGCHSCSRETVRFD